MEFIDVILKAGKAAVELSFFVLLPIMVVMLTIMRFLEAKGFLDWFVTKVAPLLRPFGLNGLSVFAALQVSFVSFAAPVSTLAMMDQRGVSDRHLAACLAMVFSMAQANVLFPMTSMGLTFGFTLAVSLAGGLVAAAATYYLFGRSLSHREVTVDETLHHPVAENAKGLLDVINRAGAEAFKITLGSLPILVLAMVAVLFLKNFGAFDWITAVLDRALALASIDPHLVIPTFTKYLAGGTAMMGVFDEMIRTGEASPALINESAGWLIHPFDLPGIAILMSAGPRIARVWKIAAIGALFGIFLRTIAHALYF
jgi:spore maturation protein SpmB